jgi:hypothetical protein
MSEFVELIKVVIENPSSSIVVFAICGFFIFKVKDLLQIFLDIKDLNKKRLMQKFEETYIFHEKNFLSSELKVNYERLCEEAQIKALIGCPYCSKEMAQYILSRKHITRAIRIYHRIKDNIKIENEMILPNLVMPNWRIKLNKYVGYCFYFFLSFIGLTPMILVVAGVFPNVQVFFNGQYFLAAILIFIVLFIPAFLILNHSLKPEFTKTFCELEAQNAESMSNE